MNKTLNLLIVGTGSYVCGIEEKEYGTILPAVLTYAKKFNKRIHITFICNSDKGRKKAELKSSFIIYKTDTKNLIDTEFIVCYGDPELFFKNHFKGKSNFVSIISIPDHFHFKWISRMIKENIATTDILTYHFRDCLYSIISINLVLIKCFWSDL